MARKYDYIVSEIQRVAAELGLDPQDQEFTRHRFLNYVDTEGEYTDVTKHDLFIHNGFASAKKDAALQMGQPSPQRDSDARGAKARVLYSRKLERDLAKRDYFLKELKSEIKDVFSKLPKRKVVKVRKQLSTPPAIFTRTVLLSDLHFGVFVLPHDVLGSEYNWEIAARRLAKVCQEAVIGSPTTLNVVLAGDIIHGVIHLSETGLRPVTEQMCGAVALLTSAIDYLAAHVPNIVVTCVPGNHDRMVYKSPSRALSQRWDSYATLMYTSLKAAYRKDPAVKFSIPASGIGTINTADGCMVVSHGDVEPSSGNVGSSINVRNLKDSLAKIKEAGTIKKQINVAMFGHWHTPTLQMLSTGAYIVVNGSLIGSDPYSQNALGIYNSEPAQVMFDTYSGQPLTNFKIVQVRSADTDKSLDSIIPAPEFIKDSEIA